MHMGDVIIVVFSDGVYSGQMVISEMPVALSGPLDQFKYWWHAPLIISVLRCVSNACHKVDIYIYLPHA